MRRLAVIATILGVCFATGAVRADDQTFRQINEKVLETQIRPGLERFAAAARALDDTMSGASGVAAARKAFHDAEDAWQAVQHLRRGPAEAGHRLQRVEFWPDKRGHTRKHLARLLASTAATDLQPETFAKSSVAVQGFPALERLFFAEAAPQGRGLAVARAITRNLAAIAAELLAEWTDPASEFGAVLAKPGPANPLFADQRAITAFIATDLVTGLKAVEEQKLGRPIGEKRALPKRAENWRSRRSLANVAINLEALKEVYATIAAAAKLGDDETQQAQFVLGQFDAAIKMTRALGPSIYDLLGEDKGRLKLRALRASVQEIFELTAGFLAEGMGLTMGFNSLDGD